jgi:hypothetical protein
VNEVEERLRRHLQTVTPVFAPVPLDVVATAVRRRRRIAAAGTGVGVLLVIGAAVTVPRLALTGDQRATGGADAGPVASTPAQPTVTPSRVDTAPPCPPPQPVGDRTAHVDYVDFVRLARREYITGEAPDHSNVPRSLLGRQVGVVRCELATIQPEPHYLPRDGDAGYLPAGTPLYSITGYPSTFRIAAPGPNGGYRIYEVDTAPDARVGADLLPLAGKVVAVEIRDGDYATHVLARINDPTRTRALVAGMLAAQVDQRRQPTETPLFIRFVLTDGTAVQRAWFPTAAVLQRGIQLPRAVSATLQNLLQSKTPR